MAQVTFKGSPKNLVGPQLRPAFYGTGTFGGPWNRDD